MRPRTGACAALAMLAAVCCGPPPEPVEEPAAPVPAVVEEACTFEPLAEVEGPACEAGPVGDLDVEASLPAWAAKVVDAQVKALGSEEAAARERAARVLASVGPGASKAVPALTAALADGEPRVRVRAAQALWRIGRGRDAVLPVVVEVLGSGSIEVRMAALDVVAELGPAACVLVDDLGRILDDEPPGLRAKAARALGEIGPAAWRAAPDLLRMLDDPVPWVASGASVALGRIGPPAVPAIVGSLRGGSGASSKGALASLVEMGPGARPALPALACAAREGSDEERRLALLAIASLAGPDDGDLVPLLEVALGDASTGASQAAGKALAAIGAEALPALVGVVASGGEDESRVATWALVGMEERALPAIPQLLELLEGGEPRAREAACLVLQHVGVLAGDRGAIVDALGKALLDEGWDLRWRAARALGAYGEEAVPRLVEALDDPEVVVRTSAADVLGEMGPAATGAVEALVGMLGSQDWQSTDAAARALGRIGPVAAEAAPLLVMELGRAPEVLAWTAAEALGGIRAEGSMEAVLAGFEDADPTHRKFTPAALGFLADPRAVEPLVEMLEDPSPEVRSQAAWALGRIGPAARGAVEALASAVEDGYLGYNVQAIEALGLIGPDAAKALPTILEAMGKVGYSGVRIASMRAALGVGGKASKVVPALVDALHDVDPEVGREACLALGSYGPAAKKAVPDLVEVLQDPAFQQFGAWVALVALGAVGPGAAGAAPAVIEKLRVLGTRGAAAAALHGMGAAAVPAMIEALGDDAWRTDDELARVLGYVLRGEELPES